MITPRRALNAIISGIRERLAHDPNGKRRDDKPVPDGEVKQTLAAGSVADAEFMEATLSAEPVPATPRVEELSVAVPPKSATVDTPQSPPWWSVMAPPVTPPTPPAPAVTNGSATDAKSTKVKTQKVKQPKVQKRAKPKTRKAGARVTGAPPHSPKKAVVGALGKVKKTRAAGRAR